MAALRNNTGRAMKAWLRRQSPKTKILLSLAAASFSLLFIFITVEDHYSLFAIASFAHLLGLGVLIYKLARDKNCAGLSLKSQELTALFLAARVICSCFEGYHAYVIYLVLDTSTLLTTCWVIYMMRYRLTDTYLSGLDNFPNHVLISVCAVLAIFFHPSVGPWICELLWAFSVFVEAVSVLPQLRAMQNSKVIEPFTSLYVFALGSERFLNCAHWILQVMDTRGRILFSFGYGLWPLIILVSEAVQTFILADFCYYYVKSVMRGETLMRLPRI